MDTNMETTSLEQDTNTHTLEELKAMRDYAQKMNFYGLALEVSHMIADKTMQEIESGKTKTVPHRSAVDIFKKC